MSFTSSYIDPNAKADQDILLQAWDDAKEDYIVHHLSFSSQGYETNNGIGMEKTVSRPA